jgi:hypothetical protein
MEITRHAFVLHRPVCVTRWICNDSIIITLLSFGDKLCADSV